MAKKEASFGQGDLDLFASGEETKPGEFLRSAGSHEAFRHTFSSRRMRKETS
jgi:hypothetical protein